MTNLTGSEPKHWHTAHGIHRMPDPREIPSWRESYMDADERAYVAHLVSHENLESGADVQRQPEDSDMVSGLFDLLEIREMEVKKIRKLIAAVRLENK